MSDKNIYAYGAASATPARIAELREIVTQFNTEYCAVLDRGNLELWPEFFTEDALYRVTSRENAELGLPVGLVYCEGRAMMHDRAVQTPFLLIQTLVEGPSTLHLAGCYHDRFVQVDGRWLLAERQVIHDTNILANDLVYPV
jgi:anthranilate 1,2-dioxygenase small subunit